MFFCSIKFSSHQHSERVWFSPVGIGYFDNVNSKNWTMKSFSSILRENGHLDVSMLFDEYYIKGIKYIYLLYTLIYI